MKMFRIVVEANNDVEKEEDPWRIWDKATNDLEREEELVRPYVPKNRLKLNQLLGKRAKSMLSPYEGYISLETNKV